jgi:hypothetical protein
LLDKPLTLKYNSGRFSDWLSAEIAQLVEHATENRGVVSSILTLGTLGSFSKACGRGSVVERLLAKEKVVGSNPIARSIGCTASWPSGKARVCKTLITGSNPVDASGRISRLIRFFIPIFPSGDLAVKPAALL